MHLDRLILILESVAAAGQAVSPSELQKLTGIPRPTCYRLLKMLTEHRLLDNDDTESRFVIGERFIRIALLSKTDTDVCSATSPLIRTAAIEFGESVFVSRLRNDGVAIINVETPSDPGISYVHPGLGFRPMHACSCSKVIAAFADEEFRDTILNGNLKSYTSHTRVSKDDLRQEFFDIKERGFAECVEEIEVGVSSVAAPVNIENAGAMFSVGTIGPIRRFNPVHRQSLGENLISLAKEVASTIQTNNLQMSGN